MASHAIFDFNQESDMKNWTVIDDVVMGGNSSGSIKLSAEGYGVFEGEISLENNGGFSSARYKFEKILIKKETTKVVMQIKGDGKNYQFRIRANSEDYYSYIFPFSTNGEWQEIEIPLNDMYPTFRGRRLDQANFSHAHIEEITFLIGNKNQEKFKLLIDKIALK